MEIKSTEICKYMAYALAQAYITTYHTYIITHNFMFNKKGSKLCMCYCTHPTGSDKWRNWQLSSCLSSQYSSVFEHHNLQCFHR